MAVDTYYGFERLALTNIDNFLRTKEPLLTVSLTRTRERTAPATCVEMLIFLN